MDPMSALGIGMTAAGGLFGALGGGGGGQSRQSTNSSNNWNQTQTVSPWAAFQPYLMGNEDIRGLFPEASNLYGQSAWSPTMQNTSADYYNDLFNRREIFNDSGFSNIGAAIAEGQLDPRIAAAGPITGAQIAAPAPRTLGDVRSGQGALDPTAALQGFLAGESANPWIGQQQTAITDTLTRNMMENVMPGIRHNAIAEGQYGGSRGDMAEGLAVSRLNADLAPALTQLAGSAWEAEQGRKFGVANALNQQAFDFDQADANRQLQRDSINAGNLLDMQKFNTGTVLNNNAQEMQRAAQAVANRGAGLNFAQGAAGLQDQNYTDLLAALNIPTDYGWNQLARYGSLLQPGLGFTTTDGAGTSNTSSTTTGSRPSTGSGLLSGAKDGLAIAQGLFGQNGLARLG